jgi:hypothetical protein
MCSRWSRFQKLSLVRIHCGFLFFSELLIVIAPSEKSDERQNLGHVSFGLPTAIGADTCPSPEKTGRIHLMFISQF